MISTASICKDGSDCHLWPPRERREMIGQRRPLADHFVDSGRRCQLKNLM